MLDGRRWRSSGELSEEKERRIIDNDAGIEDDDAKKERELLPRLSMRAGGMTRSAASARLCAAAAVAAVGIL